jgi:type I restriction enzyme S subunit
VSEPVRLDSIAEVRLGRQRSPKNHTGDNMVPYLRAANVTWAGIDTSDVKTMQFTAAEVETYRLEPGDILLSEASGSPKEVGKPAIWSEQLTGPVCLQNTLLRVRPDLSKVAADWLFLRLLQECVSGGFADASRGVGIHHLGAAKLASLLIELPPMEEQLTVAADVNEALSQVARMSVTGDAVARLLRSLEMGIVDHLHSAAAAVTVATDRPVSDLAQVMGGIQKQPSRAVAGDQQGWAFLRVANVGRRTLHLDEVHRIAVTEREEDRARLHAGDLLVVEGNGSSDQIGRGATWRGDIDPCTHQNHLIRVRPGIELDPEFLELVWASSHVRGQLLEAASTTSGLYTLNLTKIGRVRIPVPALTVQRDLVSATAARLQLLSAAAACHSKLEARIRALERGILSSHFGPTNNRDTAA